MFATVERRLEVLARTPSLLLYGRHDNGYAAGFVDRWRSLLPASEAVILEGSGHFPLEDEPETYTDALEGWLSSLEEVR